METEKHIYHRFSRAGVEGRMISFVHQDICGLKRQLRQHLSIAVVSLYRKRFSVIGIIDF